MSIYNTPPQNPADFLAAYRVGLNACPQCSYLLQGLPETGRCPECGFVYDPDTVVIEGIARGTSGMSPLRIVLWLFVGFVAWLGFSAVQLVFQLGGGLSGMGGAIMAGIGVVWVATLVYLLLTGKRKGEQSGRQQYLFAAGGFGNCAGQDPSEPVEMRLTLWRDVNSVYVERKGATFHRLRIGNVSRPGAPMYEVKLDAGIRCDPQQAAAIQQVLQQRIAAAHQQPGHNFNTPGPA